MFLCRHVCHQRDQFSGPWLFGTAEARTSNSSSISTNLNRANKNPFFTDTNKHTPPLRVRVARSVRGGVGLSAIGVRLCARGGLPRQSLSRRPDEEDNKTTRRSSDSIQHRHGGHLRPHGPRSPLRIDVSHPPRRRASAIAVNSLLIDLTRRTTTRR